MRRTVLTGRATPADRAREPVRHLPFEVPAGTTRIDVSYAFDAGNTLDLGLADPRLGPFPSAAGFRGWSGGARSRVFVATDDATPGYLPGDLPAGTWGVLLGLAEVAPGGCAYRVEVSLDDAPRPTLGAPPPPVPVRGGAGPYAGDLQAHTHHSDARGSLDDLARAAVDRGLDFVAVTDHNTVSHHRAIAERAADEELLLLPGEEVTTYAGHANVWGADGWIDFRATDDAAMARVVEAAHARGGLFSVNHPKAQPGCIGCDWDYTVPAAADAFEAWQGPWPNRNWESLARYDAALRAGLRPTLVGGSDRHQPPLPEPDPPALRVGSPTTRLWAEELSAPALLAAIRRGHACVSEAPDGPVVELEGEAAGVTVFMGGTVPAAAELLRARVHGARGDTLRWVGPTGEVRRVEIAEEAFEDAWRPAQPLAFVRAEVVAADAEAAFAALEAQGLAAGPLAAEARRHPLVRALSNPLYGPAPPGRGDRGTR